MTLSLLLLATFLANRISGECIFPAYLSGSGLVWDTKIQYARLMIGSTVQFHGNSMSTLDYTKWPSTKTVLYCEKRLRHEKYILRDNRNGGPTFLCVQFLKRSSYIVQRKVSTTSSTNVTDICRADRLKLDDWPLVNPTLAADYSISCPNIGGFNIKTYRTNSTSVVCSWLSIPQRMESECLPGEGLRFNFRSSRCTGGSLMQDQQNLFCLGSWTDRKFRHTIVTDGKELRPKVWLLRTPARIRNKFIGHLLSDVIVDHGKWVSSTNRFLTLNFTRKIYKKPCEDESIHCDSSSCSTSTKYCQRTCNKCSNVNEAVGKCAFEARYTGAWLEDSERAGKRQLKFNGSFVEINGASYSCLNLLAGSWMKTAGRKMLSSTFTNGCKPRFTCLELMVTSTAVVRYRVSQSIQYKPYIGSYDICGTTQFQMDPYPFYDKYRSGKKLKALVQSNQPRTAVPCNIPGTLNVTIKFQNGGRCAGSLINCKSMNSTMVLNSWNCSDHPEKIVFRCLGSFKVLYRVFLITDNLDGGEKLWCWIYDPPKAGTIANKMYILQAGDCNAETVFDVDTGNSKSFVAKINYGLFSQEKEDCGKSGEETKMVTENPRSTVTYSAQRTHLTDRSSATSSYLIQSTEIEDISSTRKSAFVTQSHLNKITSTPLNKVQAQTTLFTSTTTERSSVSGRVSSDTIWITRSHSEKNKQTPTVVPTTEEIYKTLTNMISNTHMEISRYFTTREPKMRTSQNLPHQEDTANIPSVTEIPAKTFITISDKDTTITDKISTLHGEPIETTSIPETPTQGEQVQTLSRLSAAFTKPVGPMHGGPTQTVHTTITDKISTMLGQTIKATDVSKTLTHSKQPQTLSRLSAAFAKSVGPMHGGPTLSLQTAVTDKVSTVLGKHTETSGVPKPFTEEPVGLTFGGASTAEHATSTEKMSNKDIGTTVVQGTSVQKLGIQTLRSRSHGAAHTPTDPPSSYPSFIQSSTPQEMVTRITTKDKSINVLTTTFPRDNSVSATDDHLTSTPGTFILSRLSPTVTKPVGPTVHGPSLAVSPAMAHGGPSFVGRPSNANSPSENPGPSFIGRPSNTDSPSENPGPQASVATPPLNENFQTSTIVSAPSSEMRDQEETLTTNNIRTTGPLKLTTQSYETTRKTTNWNSKKGSIMFMGSTSYSTTLQRKLSSHGSSVRITTSHLDARPSKSPTPQAIVSPTPTNKKGEVTSACCITIPLGRLVLLQILLIQILRALR